MITPTRYLLTFVAAVAAGAIVSALMLAVISGNPGSTVGQLIAGLAAATAVSAPFVFVVGLAAVAIERRLLRDLGDGAYFLAVTVIAAAAALIVEKVIFSGPYKSFGQLVPSAVAAGLAAAWVWRQMIRRNESRTNA